MSSTRGRAVQTNVPDLNGLGRFVFPKNEGKGPTFSRAVTATNLATGPTGSRALPGEAVSGLANPRKCVEHGPTSVLPAFIYNPPVHFFLILLLTGVTDSGSFWTVQTSGMNTNLRGVSVACRNQPHRCVWASGSNGVILRSTDDGKSWKQFAVPDGADLDFRDIEALDANVAYVMSSGSGDKSRIYKTTDGGKTWRLHYSDKRPEFFLDSIACDSKTHCVALSDPVQGKFLVLATDDGEKWRELPGDKMPAALHDEAGFAASGTAIALCKSGIYFGTGGSKARVFRSTDKGRSWTAVETPMLSGSPSTGIFSLACEGTSTLVAMGGDYKNPDRNDRVAIFSTNAGKTWQLSAQQPGGYRSAVGAIGHGSLAAVGPNGTDISHHSSNGAVNWKRIDALELNAVTFDWPLGWAVGPKGVIARSGR